MAWCTPFIPEKNSIVDGRIPGYSDVVSSDKSPPHCVLAKSWLDSTTTSFVHTLVLLGYTHTIVLSTQLLAFEAARIVDVVPAITFVLKQACSAHACNRLAYSEASSGDTEYFRVSNGRVSVSQDETAANSPSG